eukprot:CAMPEP_0178921520 /NCGR_PEP_ID=MMETSP0786-20121207/15609_1 /TAXON_ID=186022 /ORGANISM="Thalassionema frauenfeldii, Strain CCMP 1798" /LENGTH=522 /DNA_ID=CAMNT_0020595713 /DNA_START=20 /DNA_END=1588 /DNA_ORIENTATION=-
MRKPCAILFLLVNLHQKLVFCQFLRSNGRTGRGGSRRQSLTSIPSASPSLAPTQTCSTDDVEETEQAEDLFINVIGNVQEVFSEEHQLTRSIQRTLQSIEDTNGVCINRSYDEVNLVGIVTNAGVVQYASEAPNRQLAGSHRQLADVDFNFFRCRGCESDSFKFNNDASRRLRRRLQFIQAFQFQTVGTYTETSQELQFLQQFHQAEEDDNTEDVSQDLQFLQKFHNVDDNASQQLQFLQTLHFQEVQQEEEEEEEEEEVENSFLQQVDNIDPDTLLQQVEANTDDTCWCEVQNDEEFPDLGSQVEFAATFVEILQEENVNSVNSVVNVKEDFSPAPSTMPSSNSPSHSPSNFPTRRPTPPTPLPTPVPTPNPTPDPTPNPTPDPTPDPTPFPTSQPPTSQPTNRPTPLPTHPPTNTPTNPPTSVPTNTPTNPPTNPPTNTPQANPPTRLQTNMPTRPPTTSPTRAPQSSPTGPSPTQPSQTQPSPTQPSPTISLTTQSQRTPCVRNVIVDGNYFGCFDGQK